MAKRRANGEGNIRKRSDGRWEGRYTAGRDPNTGKAIYKNVLAKTQREPPGAGKIAQPPGCFLPFRQPRFQRIRLRQNAQGKGSAEDLKRKLDKFSPHLPAVRTVTLQAQREHPARIPQRRPVGADAHPLGWGKHSVRLYAVRTRRGEAPAFPLPLKGCESAIQRGTPHAEFAPQ